MKIRTNFVSNSSSSSFVIVVGENEFYKTIEEMEILGKERFINKCKHFFKIEKMNDTNVLFKAFEYYEENDPFIDNILKVIDKIPNDNIVVEVEDF